MRLMLYIHGNSLIHKISPGIKLAFIAIVSSIVMLIESWILVVITALLTIALYAIARITLLDVIKALKPMLWFLAIIFLLQLYFYSTEQAFFIVLRLLTLILLTILVTFTTKVSAMVETIEWVLSPLRFFNINTAKISLAISLAIRFIPILSLIIEQVKEAQKVRGLEKNIFALVLPVTVRTLKMCDDIADAIDARLFK